MITDQGNCICDVEIWSRKRKMWVGCRRPAKFKGSSEYICDGLDFCAQHRERARAYALAQCDCCGKYPVEVERLVAFGIDTSACDMCRIGPQKDVLS